MARKPLTVDSESEFGRLHVLDLGGGNLMLMIEGESDALTFPLDGSEARAVAQYLAGGRVSSTGTSGRPRTAGAEDALTEVARLYETTEAGAHPGGRVEYVAAQMGIGRSAANYRVGRAREGGYITQVFRGNGAP